MNPLLTGVCAFALGNLATAGTEASSDWLGLDEELNAIASNVNLQGGGVELGALVRAAYISASGDDFGGFTSGEDQLGLVIDDAELWSQGNLGDYFWRVSVDFGDGFSPYFLGNLNGGTQALNDAGLANTTRNDTLEDAYARWNFHENFNLQVGHYIFPTTFSSSSNMDSLLLLSRTSVGEYFHSYSLGAMLSGDYDGTFLWHLAVLNGADGTDDDQELRGRAIYNIGGGRNRTEGALGANDELNAAIGVSYVDDGELDDGSVLVFDAIATVAGFSIGGEYAAFDDDHATVGPGFGPTIGLNYTEGMDVIAFNLGYLLSENWELGGRYEQLDDEDDSTLMSIGINYYQMGHNAKWQLMYMDLASDVAAQEGSLIGLGLTVGSNG
jgi:hypothetical protein